MLKSKYNNLKELLKEVKATRGLDTNIEFIVHVQDLIGHSSIEDLHNLSQEYKETFYWIYDEAEGTEATLKFFAEHSKFSMNLQQQLADAEADRDKYNFLYQEEQKKSLGYAKERNAQEAENIRITAEKNDLRNENEALKAELIALKAKLYDLMTA